MEKYIQLLNFQSRKSRTIRRIYVAGARFAAPPWVLATSNVNWESRDWLIMGLVCEPDEGGVYHMLIFNVHTVKNWGFVLFWYFVSINKPWNLIEKYWFEIFLFATPLYFYVYVKRWKNISLMTQFLQSNGNGFYLNIRIM